MDPNDFKILQESVTCKKVIDTIQILNGVNDYLGTLYDHKVISNVSSIRVKVEKSQIEVTDSVMLLRNMLSIFEYPGDIKEITVDFKEELDNIEKDYSLQEKLSFLVDKIQAIKNDKKIIGVNFHKSVHDLEIINDAFYVSLTKAQNWINSLLRK
jgi:hypothetical protein